MPKNKGSKEPKDQGSQQQAAKEQKKRRRIKRKVAKVKPTVVIIVDNIEKKGFQLKFDSEAEKNNFYKKNAKIIKSAETYEAFTKKLSSRKYHIVRINKYPTPKKFDARRHFDHEKSENYIYGWLLAFSSVEEKQQFEVTFKDLVVSDYVTYQWQSIFNTTVEISLKDTCRDKSIKVHEKISEYYPTADKLVRIERTIPADRHSVLVTPIRERATELNVGAEGIFQIDVRDVSSANVKLNFANGDQLAKIVKYLQDSPYKTQITLEPLEDNGLLITPKSGFEISDIYDVLQGMSLVEPIGYDTLDFRTIGPGDLAKFATLPLEYHSEEDSSEYEGEDMLVDEDVDATTSIGADEEDVIAADVNAGKEAVSDRGKKEVIPAAIDADKEAASDRGKKDDTVVSGLSATGQASAAITLESVPVAMTPVAVPTAAVSDQDKADDKGVKEAAELMSAAVESETEDSSTLVEVSEKKKSSKNIKKLVRKPILYFFFDEYYKEIKDIDANPVKLDNEKCLGWNMPCGAKEVESLMLKRKRVWWMMDYAEGDATDEGATLEPCAIKIEFKEQIHSDALKAVISNFIASDEIANRLCQVRTFVSRIGLHQVIIEPRIKTKEATTYLCDFLNKRGVLPKTREGQTPNFFHYRGIEVGESISRDQDFCWEFVGSLGGESDISQAMCEYIDASTYPHPKEPDRRIHGFVDQGALRVFDNVDDAMLTCARLIESRYAEFKRQSEEKRTDAALSQPALRSNETIALVTNLKEQLAEHSSIDELVIIHMYKDAKLAVKELHLVCDGDKCDIYVGLISALLKENPELSTKCVVQGMQKDYSAVQIEMLSPHIAEKDLVQKILKYLRAHLSEHDVAALNRQSTDLCQKPNPRLIAQVFNNTVSDIVGFRVAFEHHIEFDAFSSAIQKYDEFDCYIDVYTHPGYVVELRYNEFAFQEGKTIDDLQFLICRHLPSKMLKLSEEYIEALRAATKAEQGTPRGRRSGSKTNSADMSAFSNTLTQRHLADVQRKLDESAGSKRGSSQLRRSLSFHQNPSADDSVSTTESGKPEGEVGSQEQEPLLSHKDKVVLVDPCTILEGTIKKIKQEISSDQSRLHQAKDMEKAVDNMLKTFYQYYTKRKYSDEMLKMAKATDALVDGLIEKKAGTKQADCIATFTVNMTEFLDSEPWKKVVAGVLVAAVGIVAGAFVGAFIGGLLGAWSGPGAAASAGAGAVMGAKAVALLFAGESALWASASGGLLAAQVLSVLTGVGITTMACEYRTFKPGLSYFSPLTRHLHKVRNAAKKEEKHSQDRDESNVPGNTRMNRLKAKIPGLRYTTPYTAL